MAIVQVQAPAPVAGTSVTTLGLAWSSTTTAGNFLVAVLQTRLDSSNITAPTGMTISHEGGGVRTTEKQYIYVEENCAARSGTQTFSWTTTSDATLHLIEYSGIVTTAAKDQTAVATGNSANPDSGTTGTTTQADELWFGALCIRNVGTLSTPTNGFAQVNRAHSANGTPAQQLEGAIYEKIVSGTGTANVSATAPTARNWGGLIATYKAAAAAADAPPKPTIVTYAVQRAATI